MKLKFDKQLKVLAVLCGVILAYIVILAGPVAGWLQCRERQIGDGTADAVYLLAGAEDQNRRIDAIVKFIADKTDALKPKIVLVGNDVLQSHWLASKNRIVSEAEHSVEKLEEALNAGDAKSPGVMEIKIVPGWFLGTDDEMEAFSDYLDEHLEFNSVVLVSSPFHLRRVFYRLEKYLKRPVSVSVLSAREKLVDHSPRVVMFELCKILRDSLGLARKPLFSRRGWWRWKYHHPEDLKQWQRQARIELSAGIVNSCLIAVLAYTWILYPWILKIVSGRIRRAKGDEKGRDVSRPVKVSILIAAYNEEGNIGFCLEKLLEAIGRMVLPGGIRGCDVIVGVDGPGDRTAEIARGFMEKHTNVFVHDFPERRGKVAVLKDLVRLSDCAKKEDMEGTVSVLVFADANTIFRADALMKLLERFHDSGVGGVCGRLVLRNADGSGGQPELDSSAAEGVYWKWETELKEMESEVDSCLGANGAIYAIRRELFWRDIPDNTIVDDFVMGMKVRENGGRMVYAPDAVAMEETPALHDEWRRRVRIGSGDFQALGFCRQCLMPRYGWFAWMFWSHKVLRWVTPHILLVMAVASLVRWFTEASGHYGFARHFFIIDMINHLVFMGVIICALCVLAGRLFRVRSGLLGNVDHFITMQAALFVGFLRFCRGNLKGYWHRTPR